MPSPRALLIGTSPSLVKGLQCFARRIYSALDFVSVKCAVQQLMEAGLQQLAKIMNIQTETEPKKKFIQTSAFGVPEYELRCVRTYYKPRISPEHLSKLRVLKRSTHKPITELVAEGLDMYFTK